MFYKQETSCIKSPLALTALEIYRESEFYDSLARLHHDLNIKMHVENYVRTLDRQLPASWVGIRITVMHITFARVKEINFSPL